MRLLLLFLFALAAIVLTSCGLLTPEQQSDALLAIDDMLARGIITQAQYEALREAILSGGTMQWWQQLVQVLGGAALAYAGVQWRRGPVAPPAERAARKAAAKQPPKA